MDHPKLDRLLIRDYLLKLIQSVTSEVAKGRSYEDQFAWLMEKRDPKSGLEAEFLRVLLRHVVGSRHALSIVLKEGVYCETDFYYERDGLNGVAIFIDGPATMSQVKNRRTHWSVRSSMNLVIEC